MRRLLLVVTFLLMFGAIWIALTVGAIKGPPANPDSPVRNIFYAHVPSSICSLICFLVLLVVSIGYLYTGRPVLDLVALAAVEVGLLFATVLNATGSIFSRGEWGVWWTPTPRLVTSAILWFLYVAYLILRSSLPGSAQRRARICAVFAIIAFLDVPLVIISARFIPDMHRASFEFTSTWQTAAFVMSMMATVLLAATFIWLRADLLISESKLQEEIVL
ncbi:MAG: cytochrome c biogenesis protein CcsA [Phycisphaerales bacterium]|nr:MAG: cytochrome c biogenesis protein CcsA [Phycisphaerales bacterium]